MTALTLPTKHRSLWHFVPGLALTAALTGADTSREREAAAAAMALLFEPHA